MDNEKKITAAAKQENDEAVELKDLLTQPDRNKWRYCGPTVQRGDMNEAMMMGRNAEKMQCNCWNTHCPFFGNCRKCIVFHKSLMQFPTCLRGLLTELYLDDQLDIELHIDRDADGKPLPEPDWDDMYARGVTLDPNLYKPKTKE